MVLFAQLCCSIDNTQSCFDCRTLCRHVGIVTLILDVVNFSHISHNKHIVLIVYSVTFSLITNE